MPSLFLRGQHPQWREVPTFADLPRLMAVTANVQSSSSCPSSPFASPTARDTAGVLSEVDIDTLQGDVGREPDGFSPKCSANQVQSGNGLGGLVKRTPKPRNIDDPGMEEGQVSDASAATKRASSIHLGPLIDLF